MSKPITLPTAFPTDKRGRMRMQSDGTLIATHPERTPHAYIDGKWRPIQSASVKAA